MATRTAKAEKNGIAEEAIIMIPRMDVREMELTVIGDSPLIVHAWSEKAKTMIKDKQGKKARTGREVRDPQAEYEASMYRMENGGYGFPATGFKAAAVSACRYLDMKMTEARGAFHIIGEMVEIKGEPRMREDMVRIGMGVADIRYRAEFPEWRSTLTVRYNAHALSPAQIVNLFNTAGFGVGVGEWRPGTNGSYGMFHVETEA